MAVHKPHHVGQSRRLIRSRRSIWFSGVCGGLGEYLGIDPSFIRLAFGLLGGFGLVAYIAAWIVIPLAPREDAEPAGSAPGLQGITIGLLLACAVLAAYLLATPNTMTVGTGILLAPAVIAIGAALVRPARLTQKGALVILASRSRRSSPSPTSIRPSATVSSNPRLRSSSRMVIPTPSAR